MLLLGITQSTVVLPDSDIGQSRLQKIHLLVKLAEDNVFMVLRSLIRIKDVMESIQLGAAPSPIRAVIELPPHLTTKRVNVNLWMNGDLS